MFIEKMRYFNVYKEFLFLPGMIVTTRNNDKYIYHDLLICRGGVLYAVLFSINNFISMIGYDKNFNYIGKTYCNEEPCDKYDIMKIEISYDPCTLWKVYEKDDQIKTSILWERHNTRGISGLNLFN